MHMGTPPGHRDDFLVFGRLPQHPLQFRPQHWLARDLFPQHFPRVGHRVIGRAAGQFHGALGEGGARDQSEIRRRVRKPRGVRRRLRLEAIILRLALLKTFLTALVRLAPEGVGQHFERGFGQQLAWCA